MLEKQMELFEEGGQVDPVSGNDVPLGSTEKEVRDDQPAMLSEGEMVVPADVVRYFGVEHFMKLRDEAKMGYKKMEAMGQFGTEEGQTLPDDTLFNAGGPPFTIEDIEVIEPDGVEEEKDTLEANAGAFVQGGQETNPFDNSAATTAGQQFAAGKPITPSSFSQPAFTFDSFKGFSGLTSDYIKSFLPDAFKKEKPEATNLATNIIDTFYGDKLPQQAQGDSTKAGQSDVPDAGGLASTSSAAPGIGSVSELMSNPSTASLNSLSNFGGYLDSTIGRAALGVFDQLSGFALTPSMGAVTGLKTAASMLSPTIAKGFRDVNNIATMDAKKAKAAALSMKAEIAALTPAEIANLNTYALFNSISNVTGYDPTVDPAVSAVGMTSMGVPGYSVSGPLGATYGWNDDLGRYEVVADELTKTDPNKGKKTSQNIAQSVAETMQMMNDPAIDRGMGGGPQSAEAAMGSSRDEASNAEAAGAGDTDPSAAAAEAADVAAGADPAGNEAAAAAAAANAANDGTDGDGGGPDGEGGADSGPEGIAKGGLIKRKKRRKKKRGGIGSRK